VRLNSSSSIHSAVSLLLLATLVLLVKPSGNAVAEDLLGLYIGGAIGQSRVEATETACQCDLFQQIVTEKFDKTHLAFQGVLGARPISLVGAEIDYIDFGKPDGHAFTFPASASIKGVAAFGVLYLPVPVVDIYLKAGVARLASTVKYSYCGPCACNICLNSIQLDRTNTTGAGGVGAQYRFGSWAVRTEYERFNATGGNPSLLSAGITWTFF
jgi:Outer membrane protein beta-barrel domain